MTDYNRLFEKVCENSQEKTLLLHVCCAPCLASAIERVARNFRVTLFYYNPNIRPEAEYEKRYGEIKKLLDGLDLGDVEVIKGDYETERFDRFLIPKKDECEGGSRCDDCIAERLMVTAEIARKNHFDYFCTTLTSSPHKNAEYINSKGYELSADGCGWLPSDFKKRDGVLRSKELCSAYGIYRQNYCGCTPRKDSEE